MADFRPIAHVLGLLLIALAAAMALPAALDAATGHPDWRVFAAAAAATLFVGGGVALATRCDITALSVRDGFLLTTLTWLVLPLFAALPFRFAALELSFADAFFEAMSGITTTGATVIVGLDTAPPGILLWRALLQWLGGIGVIVMAIVVFPALRIGGMQLFRLEFSERGEKALPRVAQVAGSVGMVYLALTAAIGIAYALAGMTELEAVAHAMTTIATGGFSTRDASIGGFDDWRIELIGFLGMLAGGLPFLLLLQAAGGRLRPLVRDSQVRLYLALVAAASIVMAAHLWLDGGEAPGRALLLAAFNVTSVITGTGYASHAYDAWGPHALVGFLFLMVTGGCAGSTTCGIKIFRFLILLAAAKNQMRRLLQPSGVFIAYYNRRPIGDDVIVAVLSFFFLYAVSIAGLAGALGLLGLDFITALSSAVTAISNVGPGLGPVVGPTGSFQPLPDLAKWLMSGGMLLGRLELLTVLVLFTRSLWRP